MDTIYALFWKPSQNDCVIGYEIFRNGKKIAFVPSNRKPQYFDHHRGKKTDIYSVKAKNSFGQFSDPITMKVKRKS